MKTINVSIASVDLAILKQNKYALCYALKEANMGYDVICAADMDYMGHNVFGVSNEYQIFCCSNITNNEKINISTESADISIGQQVTINENGIFSGAVSGRVEDAFELINNFGRLYPGFSRKISFRGNEKFLPVFISPYISIKGSYSLKPDNMVRIWFEQFAESGVFLSDFLQQMIKVGQSTGVEVFLDKDKIDISYQNGNWIK